MLGHVDGAGAQAHHQRLGVGDDLERHLVDLGAFAPVVGKLLQDNVVLCLAGDVLEGAGADDVGVGIGTLGHDGDGHLGVELRIRGAERDDDGLVVGRFDVGDGLDVAHQGLTGVETRGSPQRIDNIPDRDRITVMEADAFTQGVGKYVRGLIYGVAFGNGGDEISVSVGLYKPFKDVEKDLSGSCRRRRYVRVKTRVQICDDANNDFAALQLFSLGCGRSRCGLAGGAGGTCRCCILCLTASACAECSSHEHCQNKSENTFFHCVFSPFWLQYLVFLASEE